MKRTASTSPGTAPRTAIGPVRQWPLRLLLTIAGTFSPGNVCGCRCPGAFNERSTIVSPGSTVSTGGRSRENTSAVVDGDGSSWWRVMRRSSPLCSSATMRDRQLDTALSGPEVLYAGCAAARSVFAGDGGQRLLALAGDPLATGHDALTDVPEPGHHERLQQ